MSLSSKSTMIGLGLLFILALAGVAYYLRQDSEGFSDYDMDDEDMSLDDDHSTSENMVNTEELDKHENFNNTHNSETNEGYQNSNNMTNTNEHFTGNVNNNREGFQTSSMSQGALQGSTTTSAADLLPYAADTQHDQLVPNGQGSIWDGANLNAGHHLGVDTVGSSLRNPNLQLRSEPPNPRVKVSPWNQSTIGVDLSHKHFEIGTGN
jgi:hypothetical protein